MAIEDDRPQLWSPPPKHATVWRYMSLAKLISLLTRRNDGLGRLFFSRADLLGDPWEGATPQMEVALRSSARPGTDPNLDWSVRANNFGSRKWALVNCWHKSEQETAALWSIYSTGEAGVAVRSTYGRLRTALVGVDSMVGIGTVRYIDYSKDRFNPPEPNRVTPLLHKRAGFAHESELRAIYLVDPPMLPDNPAAEILKPGVATRLITPDEMLQDPPFAGFEFTVDASILIEAIHMSPSSPWWAYEAVKAVLGSMNYQIQVRPSEFSTNPDY